MFELKTIREIFESLTEYETYMLQVQRQKTEQTRGIKFASLEAYINHLAKEIWEQDYAETLARQAKTSHLKVV